VNFGLEMLIQIAFLAEHFVAHLAIELLQLQVRDVDVLLKVATL